MDRLNIHWSWGLGLMLALLIGGPVKAAEPAVTLTGPSGEININQVVPVEIRIDSSGQQINAADLTFSFAADYWQVEQINQEQSIFTLWPVPPVANNRTGQIHLVGGRPNGVVAQSAPVATIYLTALKPGSSSIELVNNDSHLYRNDGLGTAINLLPSQLAITVHDVLSTGFKLAATTVPTPGTWSNRLAAVIEWAVAPGAQYSYQWSTDPSVTPDDQPDPTVGRVTYEKLTDGRYFFTIKNRPAGGSWSAVSTFRFLIDRTPPGQFEIISLNPDTVGGHEVVSWATTDATSGVDHAAITINGRVVDKSATSPFTLRPEWRGKKLSVTVYDAAGNSTSAQRLLAGRLINYQRIIIEGGALVLTIILITGWLIYRRRRQSVI